MSDFLVAIGLVLVIEGLLLAAFPGWAKHTMAIVIKMQDAPLRLAGIGSALAGVVIVWLVRGLR